MSFNDSFKMSILCGFILIVLIGQQFYLIKGSINKIYRIFMWILSIFVAMVTFFNHTSTQELIHGIIYSVLFLALSFLRKGITKRGLLGIKGDSCKWSKVNSVKLLKHRNKIKLIYTHYRGESYMFFDYNDYDRLTEILVELLSENQISFQK